MKTRRIILVLTALFINALLGAVFASFLGVNPVYGAVALNLVAFAAHFIPREAGALRADVYKEIWTDQIVKHFTHADEGGFLKDIPDFSQYAENDTIHLTDVCGDPSVLIDNTTYPLDVEQLEDKDVAIRLSKFETKATSITDDELYALSYDKIKVAKERHANKLAEARHDKALHAFAPVENTPDTPVVFTSGSVPTADGRLPLTVKDILTFKNALDKAKIPKEGRYLVLCSDHVNDLLSEKDQKFKDQYYNYSTGAISKMYGFNIYEYSNCPLFDQNRKKKAFGALAGDGDFEASVFFYAPRMFKCNGSVKMYYSQSTTDPINKRSLISFTSRFVALPQIREKSCGAIVSRKYTANV